MIYIKNTQIMYKCKTCLKEFESRYSYIGHCSTHKRGEQYKIGRKKNTEKNKSVDKFCKYCFKKFKNGWELGGHQSSCKLDPGFEEKKQIKADKLSGIAKGRKLSDAHKNGISVSLKKYLDENPGNIPYLKNHSSKESYPESILRKALIKREIVGWIQEYPFKRYSLDFAFVDKMLDVEIDGETHLSEGVKKKDKERDLILENNGWTVMRITSLNIKKDADSFIDKILEFLERLT
jgi:very-short-patch-repair endonuclease